MSSLDGWILNRWLSDSTTGAIITTTGVLFMIALASGITPPNKMSSRRGLPPEKRASPIVTISNAPVRSRPPLITNIAPTVKVAVLAKPESASPVSRIPVNASAAIARADVVSVASQSVRYK